MISTVYNPALECFDLAGDRELVLRDDLRTAALISLLTDARVGSDGGWWGEALALDRRPWGSELWAVMRTPRDATFDARLRESIQRALAWMLEDEIASAIDLRTDYTHADAVLVAIKITGADHPRYRGIWELSLEF
jgi:phage gp46-like protein